MSLERLSVELSEDPTAKGYATMTDAEIVAALYDKNIPKFKIISSAELLAWAGGNARLVKLENAAANHASDAIKNIAKIAVKMLDRDTTEFDFSKPDRIEMLNALIFGGVFDTSDKEALETLATYYISRADQIGLPANLMVGDIEWARNH